MRAPVQLLAASHAEQFTVRPDEKEAQPEGLECLQKRLVRAFKLSECTAQVLLRACQRGTLTKQAVSTQRSERRSNDCAGCSQYGAPDRWHQRVDASRGRAG